ncbi:MAG: hypothetical protein AAF488_09625 [Planctomycetota bacterium]
MIERIPTNDRDTRSNVSSDRIEALLPLVGELEAIEALAADWDSDRLAFDASHSNCATLPELESFVSLQDRLGESIYEDPTLASIASHLDGCAACAARVKILGESPRTTEPQPRPVADHPRRRPAPILWHVAAGFLGFAALAWYTLVGPTSLQPNPNAAGSPIALESSSPNEDPTAVADIVHFHGTPQDDGSRIDRIEIAMGHEQEIVVFLKGWNHDCSCVEWQRAEARPAEMGYIVDLDVTDHPEIDQTILVLAGEDLPVESTLCCFQDSDPESDDPMVEESLDRLHALPVCLEEERVLALHDFNIGR